MSNTASGYTNPNPSATTELDCCIRNIKYIKSNKSKFNIKFKLFCSKIGFTKRSCTFQVCFFVLIYNFFLIYCLINYNFLNLCFCPSCMQNSFIIEIDQHKFSEDNFIWTHSQKCLIFRKPVPPQSPNTPLTTPNAGQVRW